MGDDLLGAAARLLGTIGLLLLARMSVRRIDLPKNLFPRRPAFRTKIGEGAC